MALIVVQEDGDGDHTTLAGAFAAANPGDDIEIRGSWNNADTSSCTVSDSGLTVTTDAASRHPGYTMAAGATYYRLEVSNGDHAITIDNNVTSLTFDGAALRQAGTGSSDEVFRWNPPSNGTAVALTVRDCVIHGPSSAVNQQDGIYINISSGDYDITLNLEQCYIHGFGRGGLYAQNYNSGTTGSFTLNANSCGIYNNGGNPGETNAGGGLTHRKDSNVGMASRFFVKNCWFMSNQGDYSHNDLKAYQSGTLFNFQMSAHDNIDSDNSIALQVDGVDLARNLASRTLTDNATPGAGDWVIVQGPLTEPHSNALLADNETDNDAQQAHGVGSSIGLTIRALDITLLSRPQGTNFDIGPSEVDAGVIPPGPSFIPKVIMF